MQRSQPTRAKLTKTFVNSARPASGEIIYWDTEVHGFGLRVTPAGAKSYVLRTRLGKGRDGKPIKPTIGKAGDLTPEQARGIAREWKVSAAQGVNPLDQIKAEADAPTVAELCEAFMKARGRRKRSATGDQWMIDKYIAPRKLSSKRVKDVKRGDIVELHTSMEATPYQANRVLALLSTMFNFAVGMEWIDKSPVSGVKKFDEEKRDRYLSTDELGRLRDALDCYVTERGDRDAKDAADIIRLLVLTGARKGEVLSAQWSQFDLDAGVWVKPSSHTKQKKIHRVPLSPQALAVLESVRERKAKTSDHLFPAPGGRGRRGDIKSAWADITKRAGLDDVRVHDLRHTYASLLVGAGVSLHIVGGLLGHSQAQTTARYAHLADDPLRAATAKAGGALGQ